MGATILLVGADASNRSDWGTLLENYGYKVVKASDANSALMQCPSIQPDLVLTADALPDLSGFELCRQIKSSPLTRSTPVVMMLPPAASSDAAHSKEAHDAGVDDFWGRPSSRWEALNRIQTILHLKDYIDRQAESVVLSLARSLEAKDPGTEGHSERLAGYALQLGESLGLPDDQLATLRIASLVHDIGKVAVPDTILLKPGRLSAIEMELMQQHPVVGESICAPLKSFHEALPAIRHHHERMDGSGYPDGLKGEEIPLLARIIQTADIYDALTTDRPYRKAMSQEWALAVMMTEAYRGWLDFSLVCKFTNLWQSIKPHVPEKQYLALGFAAPIAPV